MRPEPARSRIPVARPWLPDTELYISAIRDILDRRFVSNFSKYCGLLEARGAKALDCETVMCTASCDIGMVLAWRALGCHGGEVITPSYTFCSTVNALRWNGLIPVFADVDPRTLCVDPEDVRRKVTSRTVGIVAVHVFGMPAPIDQLELVARDARLKLVFDAAHGLGARHAGRALGSFGDASVFSLSGTKPVTAGEGGLVAFRDHDAAEHFRHLRGYGFVGDYNCGDIGLNGKLSEMNAALGWVSLNRLEETTARRAGIAARYVRALEDLPCIGFQSSAAIGDRSSFKDFAVLFPSAIARARVKERLDARGIETKRYFLPVHTMDAYRGWSDLDLPVTRDVYERVLCLPIFHELEDTEIDQICRVVQRALQE